MKAEHLYVLLATIYMAPHLNKNFGFCLAIVCITFAIYFRIWG